MDSPSSSKNCKISLRCSSDASSMACRRSCCCSGFNPTGDWFVVVVTEIPFPMALLYESSSDDEREKEEGRKW